MRKAKIYNHGILAGELVELELKKRYRFNYSDNYDGDPISLSMQVKEKEFVYETFPPFFEGLLPEGVMLSSLLRIAKLDADDLFAQLVYVGEDLIGSVTVGPAE